MVLVLVLAAVPFGSAWISLLYSFNSYRNRLTASVLADGTWSRVTVWTDNVPSCVKNKFVKLDRWDIA